MAKGLKPTLVDIANAIREKDGKTDLMTSQEMSARIREIQTGITPTGKLTITDTAEKDVTNYAKAQVVDANLKKENIKKGVNILGIDGTLEGGGTAVIAPTLTYSFNNSASGGTINSWSVTRDGVVVSSQTFSTTTKICTIYAPNGLKSGDVVEFSATSNKWYVKGYSRVYFRGGPRDASTYIENSICGTSYNSYKISSFDFDENSSEGVLMGFVPIVNNN